MVDRSKTNAQYRREDFTAENPPIPDKQNKYRHQVTDLYRDHVSYTKFIQQLTYPLTYLLHHFDLSVSPTDRDFGHGSEKLKI